MRGFSARSRTTGGFAPVLVAGAAGIAIAFCTATLARADEVTVTRTYQPYPGGPQTVTTETHMVAPDAPPELRTEVIPPAPNDLVVWYPGHWNWSGVTWEWDPGHYVTRPRMTAMWQPGHWQPREAGGFMWVEGHWD